MLEFVTSQISWLHRKPCLYEFYVNIFSLALGLKISRRGKLLTCDKQDVVRGGLFIVVGEHGGQASTDLREVRRHGSVLKYQILISNLKSRLSSLFIGVLLKISRKKRDGLKSNDASDVIADNDKRIFPSLSSCFAFSLLKTIIFILKPCSSSNLNIGIFVSREEICLNNSGNFQ